MKFAVRSRSHQSLPGVWGPARLIRGNAPLGGLTAGDVVFLERADLDRSTAQHLVDTGVAVVVHTGSVTTGRYPTLGSQTLLEADVVVVDGVGPEVLGRLKPGQAVRLHEGAVHDGEELLAQGRQVDQDTFAKEQDSARKGMASHLQSFTHNSAELLRREQDVLIHGTGVPRIEARVAGRPVLVVVPAHDWRAELKALKPFLREQSPVVVAVNEAADAVGSFGLRPDVVVVGLGEKQLPRGKVLKKVRQVVALVDRGASVAVTEPLERIGVRPVRFETTVTAEDVALLMAAESGVELVVGVGMSATLEDFLDHGRSGLPSTFLTRLKVGPTLVDARAVPRLYDGAVRPRHLLATVIAGVVCLAAAIGVTPVGQEWMSDAVPLAETTLDNIRGLLP